MAGQGGGAAEVGGHKQQNVPGDEADGGLHYILWLRGENKSPFH